jgi:subtilase family serine protease
MDVNCLGAFNCFTPSGTNGVLSVTSNAYEPAFRANAGWDFATGIGTLNVNNLVTNWFRAFF